MKRILSMILLVLVVTSSMLASEVLLNAITVDSIEVFQGILNADYERKVNGRLSYTIGTEVVGTLPTRRWESVSATVGARFYPLGNAINGIFLGGKAYLGYGITSKNFFSWLVPSVGYNYIADNGFTLNIGGDFIFPLTHYIKTGEIIFKPTFRLKLGYAW